jgi:hypothetical protein
MGWTTSKFGYQQEQKTFLLQAHPSLYESGTEVLSLE